MAAVLPLLGPVGQCNANREPRGEQVLVPQASEIEIAPALATEELKIKRARLELARAKDAMTRASAVKRLASLLNVGDAVIVYEAEVQV